MNGELEFQRALACFNQQNTGDALQALSAAATLGHATATIYLAEHYFREDSNKAFEFLRSQWQNGVSGSLHRLVTLKAFFTTQALALSDFQDLYAEACKGHLESSLILAHLTLQQFPQNYFISLAAKIEPRLIADLALHKNLVEMTTLKSSKELDIELQCAFDTWQQKWQLQPELQMDKCGIMLFKSVLSPLACNFIKVRFTPSLEPSLVHDPKTGGPISNKVRTSDIAYILPEHLDWFVLELDLLLENITGESRSRSESFSLLRYQTAQEYKPHYDAIIGQGAHFDEILADGGQRKKTAITYLSQDYTGGETVFPKLGLKIKASVGDVLVFNNLTQDGIVDRDSYHAGAPVEQGIKWVLTRWIRESTTHYGRVVYPQKVKDV